MLIIAALSAKSKNKLLASLVSQRIKSLRNDRKITQEDILFDTGIHIGRIETGKYNIQIDTLFILCEYFEITVIEFFSEGFKIVFKKKTK